MRSTPRLPVRRWQEGRAAHQALAVREALTALGERTEQEEQAARRVPQTTLLPRHLVRSLQTQQE